MIDEFWHTEHVINKGLTCDTQANDPDGFGDDAEDGLYY